MIRRAGDGKSRTRNGSTKRSAKSVGKRSRSEVKQILLEALRPTFPNDTVDISDGYKENIHILIVSRKFDRMMEQDKQEMVWGIIDETNLQDKEKSLISLVLPLSPGQIK